MDLPTCIEEVANGMEAPNLPKAHMILHSLHTLK